MKRNVDLKDLLCTDLGVTNYNSLKIEKLQYNLSNRHLYKKIVAQLLVLQISIFFFMPSRQSMCKCYYFSPLCLLSIKTSSIWHMQTTRGHMCTSLSTDKDLIILLFSFPFLEKIYSFLQSVCSINAICGPGTTLMPKVRIESNFSVS